MAQRGTRLVQAGLNRPDAGTEMLGDLGVGQPGQVEQGHGGPLPGGQRGDGGGDLRGDGAGLDQVGGVAPTVAKTQRWVKIFSGPSATDIKPNADKTKGSHTVELNATGNAQIGTYVADGAGRTLYRFDNDTNKPPKSNCNGSCATAWPPLLIKSPGKIFPKGIDPKLIGYVERADHSCQVTINGWPVYYFIADAKPGDINGQGVNGKWFAISPTGAKTKAIPGFPLKSN